MTNPTTITAAPGLPFVDIVREFDAPVEAVFRAHVDPELFAQWSGPRQITTEIIEFDATTGGRWKYVARDQSGEAYGFRGVFHTVEPNALIIQTFEFDGAPNAVAISWTTFERVDGRTRLLIHEVYPSVEARDGALASGMEEGINEGYERLDEILAR
ncbi:MAG: SRPBCC family protein [Dehalococcoidia bacterium]